MEPVEIDFMIGGNTVTEGKKVEQTFDEITLSVNGLTNDIGRHRTALIELQKDLVGLGIAYKTATKTQKSELLQDIELTKKNIIDEKQSIIELTAEVRQLEKQKRSAGSVVVDSSTMSNNAGRAAVGYNSLGFSMQQIIREAPSAAMGMNTFFLAISNNIPILTDQIKRASAENKALSASGQTSVPVWKQLVSSLFSWQSAMMIGITLLSMYGKDFIAWVEKILTGKKAIDKTTESQKSLNKVFSDFTGSASSKIQDVTRIGIEIEKYGNNSKNAKGIIDDFNKTFNTHLKTIEQVKKAYPELSKSAIEAAIKIQAANSLIEKSAQATLKKQEADTALSPYSSKQVKQQEDMLNRLVSMAQKYNVDMNELTTKLISKEGFGVNGVKQFIIGSNNQKEGDFKELNALNDFYNNWDNLWFAKYISQQRKAGKQIDINNKEIQKLLEGVDFKDFTKDNLTKDSTNNQKVYYDAAKAIQKLLVEVDKETSGLLLSSQDNYLQTRLDKISIEQEQEIAAIRQKSKDIVDEYNKSHRNDTGFKSISTLSEIDPEQAKKLEDEITELISAYGKKRAKLQNDYYEEENKLVAGMAEERVKIEKEYEEKINEAQANGATRYAQMLINERDKKISETSLKLIEETDLYKIATNEQINIGKQLNDKLIQQVKDRVNAEIAENKLSKKDGNKILEALDKSQASQVSDTLSGFIAKYKELNAAKTRFETAKKNGDIVGAANAANDIDNLTKSVEGYEQKIQNVMSSASLFANQAIDLLNSMSTEEGDAASSAAKSIGAVMNIANSTMQGFQAGGVVGGAVAFVMSTATQIFNAEKAHKEALAAIEKARIATQKEYNDLLLKQNKLLEAAKSIFGTNALAQANAYAAQLKAYNDALNGRSGAMSDLATSTVQTGSHKTGLFGWGGEKADYSGLLSVYPYLIDANGKLNEELAKSIIDNEKLDEASKKALQSALDYTDAYSEALDNLQSYLNSIFGDLGGDLMTAITDNLNDAKSAVDDFGDYVGKAMKKMISDIAYNIFFAQSFDKLSEQITDIYKNSSLNDKQKGDAATQAMSSFYSGIDSSVSAATDFINQMYGTIKDQTGLDLSSTSTATGIKGDVNNMTENTGSALVGAINAMRLNVAELLKNSNNGLTMISGILAILGEIKEDTSFLRKLERIDNTLYYLKNNGIKAL